MGGDAVAAFLGAVAGTLLREGLAKAVVEPVARLLFRRGMVSAAQVAATLYELTDDRMPGLLARRVARIREEAARP